jgi:hypothetical protein
MSDEKRRDERDRPERERYKERRVYKGLVKGNAA